MSVKRFSSIHFKRLTLISILLFAGLWGKLFAQAYTQKIEWSADPNVLEYKVQIQDSEGKIIQTLTTQNNYVELSLTHGNFKCNITAYDMLGREAVSTGWVDFEIISKKAELAKIAREKAEKERLEKAEAERIERERIEKELAEQAEKERLAREEAERIQAEQQRIAEEQAHLEREQAEREEAERLAREKAEREEADRKLQEELDKIAKERAEREEQKRQEAIKEVEKQIEERHEKERIEQEKERERIEALKAEEEWLAHEEERRQQEEEERLAREAEEAELEQLALDEEDEEERKKREKEERREKWANYDRKFGVGGGLAIAMVMYDQQFFKDYGFHAKMLPAINAKVSYLPVHSKHWRFGVQVDGLWTEVDKSDPFDYVSLRFDFYDFSANAAVRFGFAKQKLWIQAKGGGGMTVIQETLDYNESTADNRQDKLQNFGYLNAGGGLSLTFIPWHLLTLELGADYRNILIPDANIGILSPYFNIGFRF